MSTNLCLKARQQPQYSKLMMDSGEDKTGSTQNSSKLCENCRLIKDQLEAEIFSLKDKSHQSFMQVIQVQQLHEEEMELLRGEHLQQITTLRQQILKLTGQLTRIQQQLRAMQKNSKHHICDFNTDGQSFLIENIDMIKCMESEEDKLSLSKLDESELCQFHEIVEGKNNYPQHQRYVQDSNCIFKPKSHPGQQRNSLKQSQLLQQQQKSTQLLQQKIASMNIRILELESEVQSLWETNQQLKKQCSKLQLSQKSIKNNYQSLYKQSKFMADHIRTLANDKFKLQRKVKELEKQIKDTNFHFNNNGLKTSLTFDDNKPTISINTTRSQRNGLFASQGFQNVKTSRQNSMEESEDVDSNIHQSQMTTVSKMQSIQNFNQPKEIQLTQSEFLHVNRDIECRKLMPSYKKVSHISPAPSPSFKKKTVLKVNESKSSQFPKWSKQQQTQKSKQDIADKSDFMDEIRKQIEDKVAAQKKTPIMDHLQVHKQSALFNDFSKRRFSTNR